MRIYPKRKSNGERVYWCSWTEGGVTVRRSTRASSREAAELVAKRWERERADPAHAAAAVATLAGEARTFLGECKGNIADGTLSIYERSAGHLCRIIGVDTPLASITTDTVANYFRARRLEKGARNGTRVAESTIGLEWCTLSGILKSARHRNRFHKDPSSLRPLRFSSMSRRVERFLTWGELATFLMCLPTHRRAVVMFIIATGARRAEWRRASLADVTETAPGEWVIHLKGKKTDGADRTVPVPPLFAHLFASVMRWADPDADTMFDFWKCPNRDLTLASQRAGIEGVSFNDLRRTYASLLVQSGESEDVVMRLMGHTSTKMVRTVYGRQTAATLRGLLRDPRVNQTRGNSANEAPQMSNQTEAFPSNNDGQEEAMRKGRTAGSKTVAAFFKRFRDPFAGRNPPAAHRVALQAIHAAALAFHAADVAVQS